MLVRLVVALLASLTLLAAACGGGDDDDSPTPIETETPAPSPTQRSVSDIARSVVEIQALFDGDPIWHGSGTFITDDGLILTNAHVIDARYDEYDQLGVAITNGTDEPPSLEYIAEIMAVDYALDLAVIQVTATIDGGSVTESFPAIELADSDEVEIGDEIRILGYPGIGGETITFTNGVISGFTSERSVGNRAWIKTDATIAGGNSGGLAINARGEAIGVPTVVGSGAGVEGGFVDCRVLADTNNDGFLDDLDTCVPVGGFINGVRPVNLAQEMIAAVLDGDAYVSPYYEEDFVDIVPGDFDTSAVLLYDLIFSDDYTEDDQPDGILTYIPTTPLRVCGFWQFEGMEDGMTWDALWYIDGEIDEQGSFIADTWVGGETGSWWVCIVDEDVGLADGLYELIIQIEGEPFASEAIFVGGGRSEIELDIDSQSSSEICAVWISPVGAQNWGFEDLGPDVTIPPGDSWPLIFVSGQYDLLVEDCFGDVMAEEYDLDIQVDSTYTVTD
ncbi:MAG TPA: serine protease [Dehalococcoidia bacterium]|nr:serine protease [Dehalococcoidia bacterium]